MLAAQPCFPSRTSSKERKAWLCCRRRPAPQPNGSRQDFARPRQIRSAELPTEASALEAQTSYKTYRTCSLRAKPRPSSKVSKPPQCALGLCKPPHAGLLSMRSFQAPAFRTELLVSTPKTKVLSSSCHLALLLTSSQHHRPMPVTCSQSGGLVRSFTLLTHLCTTMRLRVGPDFPLCSVDPWPGLGQAAARGRQTRRTLAR